ncbi:MAG: HAMP domain-containing histidine kinase [Lachnospiraceae bacterium]|nr:HAMP domain-containing histidine kinase [Lachnospiraceae bacterium]
MNKKHTPYNRTIFLKFLLAYGLFAVFGFLATGTFIRSLLITNLRTEQGERLYAFATQIADTYASDLYDSRTSIETVRQQLSVLARYLEADVRIINPSGRLVIDTGQPLASDEEVYIEGFDPTVRGQGYYTVDRFFSSYGEDVLSVFAPITKDYSVRAYVTAHMPMERIARRAETFLNVCYILLIVMLLLSLIILIFFAEMVYIPIRRITEATEQYAAGNMDYKCSVESDDEIGYLAATLSYMAGEIARGEDTQRKFIANVSHDFRSPLTSIRGYLTAIEDGTVPPEQYDKVLRIVIDETDRLSKLTNGLLTLNNLNSEGITLDIRDFDIHGVIRATVASFGETCRQKKITVDLVFTEEELYVSADVERIRQVLYNLVDNAIKFSHEGTPIRIETTLQGNKVLVSVKDTGVGIPKEDLKQIFERFYKSDHSRGKDKRGTGLGLSIVKEILKAHGENIDVISTVGAGSEFVFTLPQASDMTE